MSRPSLAAVVADELLDRIVAGEFAPDALVPTEAVLAERHGVSRLTVREALKTLQAQNVLRIERGRGTFVNPFAQWTALEPVMRAVSATGSDEDVADQLIELRRMFESDAAALAASRRSDEDLDRLEEELAAMRRAHARGDVEGFVAADIAFHDAVLHATGNVFVGLLFEPLRRVLEARREQSSRVPQIQVNAIERHDAILAAIEARDSAEARAAMEEHMRQTADDLSEFVYGGDGA